MVDRHRSAGVLLHITSLPTPYGIGDLGPAAYQWVDLLAGSRQRAWQILPLHPPEAHHSPYQSLSAFAGNPLLISPDAMAEDGWLPAADVASGAELSANVNYRPAAKLKNALFHQAYSRFRAASNRRSKESFQQFRESAAGWLEDFSLFMALREASPGLAWQLWPRAVATRKSAALRSARKELAHVIERHQFIQFLFFQQLERLRAYADEKEVRLIGDLPIFVSLQSADVWANPHLFQLDRDGQPTALAGVPPDEFSNDGQLWGNPLYKWRAHEREDFAWWSARMKAAMKMAAVVRIDHFRGLDAYWSVPAGSATARNGKWIKAPGNHLLTKLDAHLGGLPAIAEDLGVITPSVERLRDQFGLPGMRILQFAFGDGAENPHLPHNFVSNSVVYTGTHDNDTTASWYSKLGRDQKKRVMEYLPNSGNAHGAVWPMIQGAWASIAERAIVPAQDLLELGGQARMNYPGRAQGNWLWRLHDFKSVKGALERLAELTKTFGRSSGGGHPD